MHQVKCITLTSVVYDYASVWFILCVCATIFGVVIVKDDIINKIPNEYRKMCGIVLSFFLHPIHLYIDLSFVSADNAFAAPIRRNNEWSHLKYIQCEVAQLCGKTANIKMSRTKNYAVFCVCLCQTYFIGYSILSPFAMRCNWTQPFSHNQRYRCLKSQTLWISSKIFFAKLNTWKSVKIATETTASIHFDTNSRKKYTHTECTTTSCECLWACAHVIQTYRHSLSFKNVFICQKMSEEMWLCGCFKDTVWKTATNTNGIFLWWAKKGPVKRSIWIKTTIKHFKSRIKIADEM